MRPLLILPAIMFVCGVVVLLLWRPPALNRALTADVTAKSSEIVRFAKGTHQNDDLGYVCEYEAMPNTYETEHFFINYDKLGRGLDIETYGDALEESYRIQVDEYGWAAPPLCTEDDNGCANPNPWGKYPVQIFDFRDEKDQYDGFVNATGDYTGNVGDNPFTDARERTSEATCMVISSYHDTPSHGTREQAVYGTAQHEFQHMIQFGYVGYGEDKSGDLIIGDMWYESISTFFEEEAINDIDYPTTLLFPDHTSCFADYDGTGDPYNNWIFFQYVAEQNNGGARQAGGGEDLLQMFWERGVRATDALETFDSVLQEYDTNLDDTLHNYAITLAFSKQCGSGEYDPAYCFDEGEAYTDYVEDIPTRDTVIKSTKSEYRGSIRQGYSMNFIDLPRDRRFSVTLDNTARSGVLRASLVCDTGDTLEITPFPGTEISSGSDSTVSAYDTSSCEQVTAIVTSHTNDQACTERAYRLRLDAATKGAAAPTATPRPQSTRRATPNETAVAAAPTRQTSTRPTRVPSGPSANNSTNDDDEEINLDCVPAMALLLVAGIGVSQRRKRR